MDENVSDEHLLEAMIEYPVLVNRPIVCSEKGVRLCRPSERIADLLPELPDEPIYKEDGELLLRGKASEKD